MSSINHPSSIESLHTVITEEIIRAVDTVQKNEESSQIASERSIEFSKKRRVRSPITSEQPNSGAPSPAAVSSTNQQMLILTNPAQALSLESTFSADNQSLIAIIGYAMALQARANSQFWSTLWQQSGASMQQAIAFAPAIYNSVIDKYNNQANAIGTQASSSKWQGIVSLVFAGFTVIAGAISGFKLASEEPEEEDFKFKNAEDAPENSPVDKLDKTASNDIEAEDKQLSNSEKLGRQASSGKTRALKGFQFFMKALDESTKSATLFNGINQGANNIINSKYQAQEIAFTKAQGLADAASQEMEQFAQFYNNSYGRQNEQAGGAQDFINNSTQIWKSISDTITQTSQHIFA